MAKLLPKLQDFQPFCHGTSSIFLDKIRREGLKPRNVDRTCVRESCWVGKDESQDNLVYLAVRGQDHCTLAAENAVERVGGKPIVLHVQLPNSFVRFAEPDEDWLSSDTYTSEDCRKEFNANGYDGDKICSSHEFEWAASLMQHGTVGIRRTISPKYIKK